jgi:two-component system, sensor histidine kinase YesM
LGEIRNQKLIINDQSVNVNVVITDKTNWKIIQIISNKQIYKETNDFLAKTMLINTILFLATLLLGYYIANTFTKPIRQLSALMEESPNSDFKQKSGITGSYEVNKLSESYNYMIDKINVLIGDIQFEANEKQKKNLEALQAQINPHFLLNTLNGIKWLCVIEEAKTAEKMLLSLGQLLENMYFKNEEIVTLEKEIELLKSYCEIQKMRYGKRFDVAYYIDDKYLDVEVPVLLLQPIVENCILHAVSELDVLGKIDITVYEEPEYIFISIADNGIGMTKEQIDRLLQGKVKDKYSGIGIKNVKDRIQLYYNGACDLTVESQLNKGTEVILKIKNKINKI